jgi:peptidoglycan/xylan/chitin deacetylase (PgdA/CDA1 family)
MRKKILLALSIFFTIWLFPAVALTEPPASGNDRGIPILVYHRFGPKVADSMTVTNAVFESHLKYLKDHGFRILPLRDVVEQYMGKGRRADSPIAALTADDGHISVYTDALPLLKKYRVPMTLFIYPSAISNASYAMTWNQLRELKTSGLFDFESHTYWHPNFKKERARLQTPDYEKLVATQLRKSKEVLERQLSHPVKMLAWPFGIYDPLLEARAAEAGYSAAFSIDRHRASSSERRMAIPRYLMSNADRGKAFEYIVGGSNVSVN